MDAILAALVDLKQRQISTQSRVEEMLASHTQTLASHTQTLAAHTQTLASHTQTLTDMRSEVTEVKAIVAFVGVAVVAGISAVLFLLRKR